MHVMWFTGVQLPAVTGAGLNRAGWQEGLRKVLYRTYPELKLSIASFGLEEYQPFQVENATYYNILRDKLSGNRWQRLVENWKHRTFSQAELLRIVNIYELVKPDLVFIFGTENPFGLLVDKFSVPSVISIQAVISGLVGSLFHGLTPWQLVQELISRQTLIGQGIFHKWWLQKKHVRFEREIYKKNKYFCGRTDWDHNWMTLLNPSAKYFHIDRVLRDPFYRAEWKIESSAENQVFSLCGNAPFKGGITLVLALAALKMNGSDQIKLRLAGVDRDSAVGINIARIIKKTGMEGQVDLLGRLDPDHIITEMKAARVFVLPSHMDNSPNSLAEAMILGMPCIASNAGGISSMIDDGKDGMLYPHAKIEALAEKIQMLITDQKLASSLGQEARVSAKERHDPLLIAERTHAMYQEVLGLEGVL